jgi:exopolyphosphatase/guanosine-5'-triphosphate,3'-diphosphate pyrophosphatase
MVDQGLTHYDRALVHHARLSVRDVAAWTAQLSRETTAERLAHPGMEPGRADVLVGGLVVLLAVMERIGATSVLHSEADILDGVVSALQRSNVVAGVETTIAGGRHQ